MVEINDPLKRIINDTVNNVRKILIDNDIIKKVLSDCEPTDTAESIADFLTEGFLQSVIQKKVIDSMPTAEKEAYCCFAGTAFREAFVTEIRKVRSGEI